MRIIFTSKRILTRSASSTTFAQSCTTATQVWCCCCCCCCCCLSVVLWGYGAVLLERSPIYLEYLEITSCRTFPFRGSVILTCAFHWIYFLGAPTHLYNWLCPLVGRSVGWLVCNAFVRRSTRRTLLAYLALFISGHFSNKRAQLKSMIW